MWQITKHNFVKVIKLNNSNIIMSLFYLLLKNIVWFLIKKDQNKVILKFYAKNLICLILKNYIIRFKRKTTKTAKWKQKSFKI